MKVLIIGLCKAAIIECREIIVKGLIDVKRINGTLSASDPV